MKNFICADFARKAAYQVVEDYMKTQEFDDLLNQLYALVRRAAQKGEGQANFDFTNACTKQKRSPTVVVIALSIALKKAGYELDFLMSKKKVFGVRRYLVIVTWGTVEEELFGKDKNDYDDWDDEDWED